MEYVEEHLNTKKYISPELKDAILADTSVEMSQRFSDIEYLKQKINNSAGTKIHHIVGEEEEKDEKKTEAVRRHSFPTPNFMAFLVTAIECQNFIKEEGKSYLKRVYGGSYGMMMYGYEKDYMVNDEVLTIGRFYFCYREKIYDLELNSESLSVGICCGDDCEVKEIVDIIEKRIKNNTLFRNKHLFLYQTPAGIRWTFQKRPVIKWEELILEPQLKEEIMDATLDYMDLMDSNNGTILYGDKGTGKSICCKALITEALQRGYSTCHITSVIHFPTLDTMLEQFLAPCLVILEDVDSFAKSRTEYNTEISDFLQFMNGVSDRSERINVVATTNYLDRLDEAIKDRPMRFNNKFKFGFPGDTERSKIIDLYFGENVVPDPLKTRLFKQSCPNLTGAHIEAIHQRFKLLDKKNEKLGSKEPVDVLFNKAVDRLSSDFFAKQTSDVGFRIS